VSHTLVIDEIRIDGSERAASGKAPVGSGNVRAKGYERHVDLSWVPVGGSGFERYIVYRSADATLSGRSACRFGELSLQTDFIGRPNQKMFYKVAASDRAYRQSPPSAAVSASTKALSDDELLTMLQEECFRYYWEGGIQFRHNPRKHSRDDRIVATGASGLASWR